MKQLMKVNTWTEPFSSLFLSICRRAFLKMCNSPEAFLSLRSHFISSHALLCVSHWILGIGDRHLSNFMINMETGGMIGIDFGHAFGSATQVSHTCYTGGTIDVLVAWLNGLALWFSGVNVSSYINVNTTLLQETQPFLV